MTTQSPKDAYYVSGLVSIHEEMPAAAGLITKSQSSSDFRILFFFFFFFFFFLLHGIARSPVKQEVDANAMIDFIYCAGSL
jgi:hypothetical protein